MRRYDVVYYRIEWSSKNAAHRGVSTSNDHKSAAGVAYIHR